MNEPGITLHRRAEAALRSLSPAEHKQILKAVQFLRQWDRRASSASGKVRKLNAAPSDIYSLKASYRLRILFSFENDGEIIVLDIASHDIMQCYFSGGEA
jgi:mRNA-degrading endonuclease RelE of RelBE toxin-antitoxin system